MTYEEIVKLARITQNAYNQNYEFDTAIQKVFGGDTYICTDSVVVNELLNFLESYFTSDYAMDEFTDIVLNYSDGLEERLQELYKKGGFNVS